MRSCRSRDTQENFIPTFPRNRTRKSPFIRLGPAAAGAFLVDDRKVGISSLWLYPSPIFGNGLLFGTKVVGHPEIAFSFWLFDNPTSQAHGFVSITETSSLLRPDLPLYAGINPMPMFPVSILPDADRFTCSHLKPTMNSAPLNPGYDVSGNQVSATLVTSTNATACFRHC